MFIIYRLKLYKHFFFKHILLEFTYDTFLFFVSIFDVLNMEYMPSMDQYILITTVKCRCSPEIADSLLDLISRSILFRSVLIYRLRFLNMVTSLKTL
jgi:hypothetical protein